MLFQALNRAVAIRLEVVRFVVGVCKIQLGGSGAAPPETFLEFRGYEYASETIFGAI